MRTRTTSPAAALIRAVPVQELVPELVLTLLEWPWDSDFGDPAVQGLVVGAAGDQHAAARLRQILTDPERVRDQVLTVLSDYWHASFAAEFERLEPGLHQAMEEAARHLAAAGPLGLLNRLIPEVVLDPPSTQELARLTQLSEAAVSKHLRTLHSAGLLSRSPEGYYVLYAADRGRISAFVQALGRELNAILPGI